MASIFSQIIIGPWYVLQAYALLTIHNDSTHRLPKQKTFFIVRSEHFSDVIAVSSLRKSEMAVLSIARFLQKSPALGCQLRQMAVMENASPVSSAVRRMSVLTNQVPHSSGEGRSRSSSGGSLLVATSATAYAAYAISAHPVMGGAGRLGKKEIDDCNYTGSDASI